MTIQQLRELKSPTWVWLTFARKGDKPVMLRYLIKFDGYGNPLIRQRAGGEWVKLAEYYLPYIHPTRAQAWAAVMKARISLDTGEGQ